MRKSFNRVSILALTAFGTLSAVSQSACSSNGAAEGASPNDDTGTVGLALAAGAGLSFASVSYAITGPGAFSKTGTLDLTGATALRATIGNLPAGNGFTITLNGTATDGSTTCTGSATFNVSAHATTAVSIALDCHQAPRSGSVAVNGVVNVCPVIDGITANPSQVNVGSTLALSAAAHDQDNGPAALTYAWTATSGTFDNKASTSPVFTCTAAGDATVTLTLSDGDTSSGCPDVLTAVVTCTQSIAGVVTSAAFTPGSATDPNVGVGYWQGAVVCVDGNANGKCDAGEASTVTNAAGHFALTVPVATAILADIGKDATNTASGNANPSRNVFRASVEQVQEQGANVVVSPLSTEVVRSMKASGAAYGAEKQNLATRLEVAVTDVLQDGSTLTGASKTALAREAQVLSSRFQYAITKLDRGDLYPDALAVPGGNPELTGLAGVSPQTATTADPRQPITFEQAEQAAFAVEGIPRYDHIFIVMLENKSTQAMLNSPFAPKINGYLRAGNQAASYYATGNPSEPNYTALGGADDFGIVDDSQWNCDATGANAVKDLPVPDKTQPGLSSSPFAATCTQNAANHNITGKPNLFTAINQRGMVWRTYSESMNPGQDFRTDSVADSAVIAHDHAYAPGTLAGNAATVGDATVLLPFPAGLYKTKHHPGMAYQEVRSEADFRYSNRTLGGGQWDSVLLNSTAYAVPTGYDVDQFGTDLARGDVGQLNFVIPDQCDDMHGITLQGTAPGGATKVTASDCSSVSNNVPVATGGNILARGDAYVDGLVKRIQASKVWNNPQKKVAIVLMFDEGNATAPDINSCCGWKAGKTAANSPLVQNADGTWSPDTSNAQYGKGNQGHGKSIFGILSNQASAPKGIVDNDVYSHFSFVRTLQDMFLLADPTKDGSYMNRSKYTEKFIAQNILNLPEYAGSADTHFDAVRPMNHAYAIPATYTQKSTADDTRPLQTGPDATQTNLWSIK